ncbi:MAG: hypothetical protein P4M02_05615 [Clostridia bacterium]|nr:hypothetical protein [Clostridia bacterium]
MRTEQIKKRGSEVSKNARISMKAAGWAAFKAFQAALPLEKAAGQISSRHFNKNVKKGLQWLRKTYIIGEIVTEM